eukprot:UN00572
MAQPTFDADEEFVVADIIAEAESFIDGDLQYDATRIMVLIDILLSVAEEDPADVVIETCLDLCDILIDRKDHANQRYICPALLRKSKCYFYSCNFILSRETLDKAEQFVTSERLEKEISTFRKTLHDKVTRDGKIAMFCMGGIVSALIFWWLKGKKKNSEAAAAALSQNNNNNNNDDTLPPQ